MIRKVLFINSGHTKEPVFALVRPDGEPHHLTRQEWVQEYKKLKRYYGKPDVENVGCGVNHVTFNFEKVVGID